MVEGTYSRRTHALNCSVIIGQSCVLKVYLTILVLFFFSCLSFFHQLQRLSECTSTDVEAGATKETSTALFIENNLYFLFSFTS